MSLEDTYSKQVKKETINHGIPSSGIPVEKTRDPKLIALEDSIMDQIGNITNEINVKEMPDVKSIEVKHIDFEEALKELGDISKLGDDKS
jgi:hypothetical protein